MVSRQIEEVAVAEGLDSALKTKYVNLATRAERCSINKSNSYSSGPFYGQPGRSVRAGPCSTL